MKNTEYGKHRLQGIPAVRDPDLESPVAGNLAVKSPVVEIPIAKIPVAKIPAAENPGAVNPLMGNLVLENPGVKNLAAGNPAAGNRGNATRTGVSPRTGKPARRESVPGRRCGAIARGGRSPPRQFRNSGADRCHPSSGGSRAVPSGGPGA